MFVGTLRLKLPTDHFPSVIQSVTTDGKVSELKKKAGSLTWRFWRVIFSDRLTDRFKTTARTVTESPRDLKWQIRTVTCRFFHQNHRRHHKRKVCRWNRWKKLIYVSSTDPLLPYFSFFFLIPTLSICKQPAPLPPI
jgi:hypothetical protein